LLEAVSEILRRRGTQGWLVGGSIRDRTLGRYSPDLDIVVDDDSLKVAVELAERLVCPWFTLSGRHQAHRVVAPNGHVDVARLRGGSIEADLAGRDFTVNAMALPLKGVAEIIDPFGGLGHLAARRLVAVSDHIFADDPLRLMRAVRLCHSLDLQADLELVELMRAQSPWVIGVAGERLASEIALTLQVGRTAGAVSLWSDLGLLSTLLPEVTSGREADRFLGFLERLDAVLSGGGLLWDCATPQGPPTPDGSPEPCLRRLLEKRVDGTFTRPVALRLAGILSGLSPAQAEGVCRRFKISRKTTSLARTVCGFFGRDSAGADAFARAAGAPRCLVQLLWRSAPWEPEVLTIAAAAYPEIVHSVKSIFETWHERAIRGVAPLPVDGHAVARAVGLDSGPLLGAILTDLRLAWESGEVESAGAVMELARELCRHKARSPAGETRNHRSAGG